MSESTKGAEGHHEWAARYGWDGVGFSEPEPSAWNRSTYAMLAAALEAHRALDPDCKVCREARALMLRPYLVHSCGDWCLEGCDGVVVFAESDPAALAAGRHLTEDPPEAAAEHDERLEPLRAAWQGEPLRPSNEHARLWWLAGWGDPESRCLECGLGEWAPEVPESVYCVECMLCADCGHDEDCPEAEAA